MSRFFRRRYFPTDPIASLAKILEYEPYRLRVPVDAVVAVDVNLVDEDLRAVDGHPASVVAAANPPFSCYSLISRAPASPD